jgi:F-type H+-transporting ATPase subunit delta
MAAVTLRYARAFASVAASMHLDLAAAQQQMRDFAATLAGSHDLREFLADPSAPSEQKLRVLDAIAARIGMFPQVRNFFAVITAHHRLDELDEIIAEFAAAANEQAGISEAEVTSARPLAADDRKALETQIARLAGASGGPNGSKVRATYREDASLLGGAVIRIGCTLYDGSVRAQLQQLKRRLIAAQVS